MNYKAYVPFLSRLAVLCNICFLIDMAIMYIPGWHLPNFLANFFWSIRFRDGTICESTIGRINVYCNFQKNRSRFT